MHKRFIFLGLSVAILIAAALPCPADLQNVTLGGEVRIRGNYWFDTFNTRTSPAMVGPQIRWPAFFLPGRAIGDFIGGRSAASYYDWDSRGADYDVIEQRTVLGVRADFTNEVSAVIEFDSFDVWGEDFRSDYIEGRDFVTGTNDDVELYQAYIEVDDLLDQQVMARIGRQEIILADGWLVGNNTRRPEFAGLSFDAARLIYENDLFSVGAFAAMLLEGGPVEQDEDVWLYGAHGAYTGIESMRLEAYWLWLRDARSVNDTNLTWFPEWMEDLFGLDDYDVTNLHTVALRFSGMVGAFDFGVNAAYQFGDADRTGSVFRISWYGNDDANYDEWAADVEVGYTLDIAWQPRMYLGFAYFGGEDNRDISFWEWLSPFDRPEASMSFNRMFSDRVYSNFLDELGELSNCWIGRAGVSATPTESLEIGMDIAYLEALETFDRPIHFGVGRYLIPIAPKLSFWTTPSDDELGWEIGLWAVYHYSEDLTFSAGWAHLFTGQGLADGNYNDLNGLVFNGGTDDEDADYLYVETALRF